MPDHTKSATLLCVCNYPSNTGYAWDFIESLYAGIADRLAARGVRTVVAYPRIDASPRTLAGSAAQPTELDATLKTFRSVGRTLAFVRKEGIRTLYFTDQPTWSAGYAALRLGGVRRIIVHDHTSGARSIPAGLRRAVKLAAARTPWIAADRVIAVSEYVARRHLQTGLLPPGRVSRVWNGIPVPERVPGGSRPLAGALGADPRRPTVACACRAAAEKGVPVLLRAFDLMVRDWPASRPRPLLVYMGDGPQFGEIEQLRAALDARDDILLTGYRSDAGELLAGADVCAMPSIWHDALPLAVMQPMALGRPVVASNVGGIPEMIVNNETGLLVPVNDERALAAAIERVLSDGALAARMGAAARQRVAQVFTPESQLRALTDIVSASMELAVGDLHPATSTPDGAPSQGRVSGHSELQTARSARRSE
jgi:glycosyltransferase involved in cell wall biosynthesis